MKLAKWMIGGALVCCLAFGQNALAQGNSQGHGKGHDKHGDDDKGDKDKHKDKDKDYYHGHDKEVHDWYYARGNNLPPGLAKKDRLPPGLETQLVRRGTLPPGLQKKIHPCPPELVRYLPPPPPECAHVLIGGNIVLLNRRTNIVVDFMNVELF